MDTKRARRPQHRPNFNELITQMLYGGMMSRRIHTLMMRASLRIEREPRFPTDAGAAVMVRDLPDVEVPLINISRSGCLFRSNLDLPLATPILLTIPGIGMHGAIIRRRDGMAYGAAFRVFLSMLEIETITRLETQSFAAPTKARTTAVKDARGMLALLQSRLGKIV